VINSDLEFIITTVGIEQTVDQTITISGIVFEHCHVF
jgi:hypothetical protein